MDGTVVRFSGCFRRIHSVNSVHFVAPSYGRLLEMLRFTPEMFVHACVLNVLCSYRLFVGVRICSRTPTNAACVEMNAMNVVR